MLLFVNVGDVVAVGGVVVVVVVVRFCVIVGVVVAGVVVVDCGVDVGVCFCDLVTVVDGVDVSFDGGHVIADNFNINANVVVDHPHVTNTSMR